MSEPQSFKRFPTIFCWIKNVLEGRYSREDNSLFTIFGKVKRVRIVATIVDKREFINTQTSTEDTFLDDDNTTNSRLEFDLDDGTGLIRAVLWNANPEQYKDFVKGDIVDIVGIVRQWKDFTSISPEIIRKIDNPNFILLRNAEILKKIKSGEIQKIPDISEEEFEIDEISGEIDINDLFEGDQIFDGDDLKEKIYSIIAKYSSEGNGISFKKLKETAQISEEELKRFVRDLEMESRIFQSEKNFYQTF
jgi:hypothetical protein